MSIPSERTDQDDVVAFFRKVLSYRSLGKLDKGENTSVRSADCRKWLSKRHPGDVAGKAVQALEASTAYAGGDFYQANMRAYETITLGVSVSETDSNASRQVAFIDWASPEANDFAVAEEVAVAGNHGKRPDLVVYVNGIALAVIELKRASVSIEEGVRQNIGNQRPENIERFFTTVSLLVAGNDSAGIRYGTTKTSAKYYAKWREDASAADAASLEIRQKTRFCDGPLQKGLLALFTKARLLDLVRNCIVFDRGVKKIARSNQFFALKAALPFIERREKGIIWHTQGSGKSLTMVWLAKLIRVSNPHARILTVTDREELDAQIEDTFKGVQLEIVRTRSCRDLFELLNATTPDLMCSLIHKFGARGGEVADGDYRKYIKELRGARPAGFAPKGEFFVFIDECHRSQSGELHRAMTEILGKGACFIGFTGTPLLKADKASNLVFGPFIHTYKINEAKEDGVVLDLMYEGRKVPSEIKGREQIDEYFDRKTKGLNDVARQRLKKRWATLQNIHSSLDRIKWIVADIETDLETSPRLRGGGTAMLAASDILAACRFWKEFQARGIDTAVITSYDPAGKDRTADSGDGDTDEKLKHDIYADMLAHYGYEAGQTDQFETEMKRRFIEEPCKMRLLIVVDKLLTGFDAPSCSYLYIDKPMRDHGLFQAVCRTNRLDGEEKTVGRIVDYQKLFEPLQDAMLSYTDNAFENFDKEDIDGLLMERDKLAKRELDICRERVQQLRDPVRLPRKTADFIAYFCGTEDLEDAAALKKTEPRRKQFYAAARAFLRAYAELSGALTDAGYSEEDAAELMRLARNLPLEVNAVMQASGDAIDLKNFDSQMRRLIDDFIVSAPVERITLPEFLQSGTIFQWIDRLIKNGILKGEEDEKKHGERQAAAETIVGNIRAAMIGRMTQRPVWFERMSKLLSDLIERYKNGQIKYEEYLRKLGEQYDSAIHPDRGYPDDIDTPALCALYDAVRDDAMAHKIYDAATPYMAEGFASDPTKAQAVKREIHKVVKDREKTEEMFGIIARNVEGR